MKVLIAEKPTTHMMVTNMNNMRTTFFPIEDWETVKPMLSENSMYIEVHITRDNTIVMKEDIIDEVNRTATV